MRQPIYRNPSADKDRFGLRLNVSYDPWGGMIGDDGVNFGDLPAYTWAEVQRSPGIYRSVNGNLNEFWCIVTMPFMGENGGYATFHACHRYPEDGKMSMPSMIMHPTGGHNIDWSKHTFYKVPYENVEIRMGNDERKN